MFTMSTFYFSSDVNDKKKLQKHIYSSRFTAFFSWLFCQAAEAVILTTKALFLFLFVQNYLLCSKDKLKKEQGHLKLKPSTISGKQMKGQP